MVEVLEQRAVQSLFDIRIRLVLGDGRGEVDGELLEGDSPFEDARVRIEKEAEPTTLLILGAANLRDGSLDLLVIGAAGEIVVEIPLLAPTSSPRHPKAIIEQEVCRQKAE